MKTGAVALIDALGFRGIWRRHNPDDVLAFLTNVKTWFEERIKTQFERQPWMQCSTTFLSDTIAVSMSLSETVENREAMSVIYLGDVLSWVLDRVLRSEMPLAYRGAIAFGDFELSQHFLIGPAIDQAAAAYELAQSATIWVTPKANEQVAQWLRNQPRNTHLVKFDVPLKGGEVFSTYTISPLEQAADVNDANYLLRNLVQTFSTETIDVAVKRQNTLRHLRACYSWRNFQLPAELLQI